MSGTGSKAVNPFTQPRVHLKFFPFLTKQANALHNLLLCLADEGSILLLAHITVWKRVSPCLGLFDGNRRCKVNLFPIRPESVQKYRD